MKKETKLLNQPLINAMIVCKTDTWSWLESDEYLRSTITLQWTGQRRDEFLFWSRVDPLSRTQETKADRLNKVDCCPQLCPKVLKFCSLNLEVWSVSEDYTPDCNPSIPLGQTKTPDSHVSVPLDTPFPTFRGSDHLFWVLVAYLRCGFHQNLVVKVEFLICSHICKWNWTSLKKNVPRSHKPSS